MSARKKPLKVFRYKPISAPLHPGRGAIGFSTSGSTTKPEARRMCLWNNLFKIRRRKELLLFFRGTLFPTRKRIFSYPPWFEISLVDEAGKVCDFFTITEPCESPES